MEQKQTSPTCITPRFRPGSSVTSSEQSSTDKNTNKEKAQNLWGKMGNEWGILGH
jgi:hypothetical protein